MSMIQSLEQLRAIGRQIDAAEREIRFAESKRDRKRACKRVASLRKIARGAAMAHRRTWGR